MNEELHGAIVDAAARLTATVGWSGVTITRVATEVGVSRQTVYTLVGDKDALAEAVVLAQLDRVLAAVTQAFDRQPDDGVRAAVEAVLTLTQDDDLLRAIVTSAHGGDSELLPLLTTRGDQVITAAAAVVGTRLDSTMGHLTARQRATVVDALVRLVLSHVMRPSGSPRETARDITWWFDRVVDGGR